MTVKYDVEKLKKCEIEMLDKFVSICKENNLDYYLAYGTLIGAVRHKGFIPWDDDIDVYMKGEDYYKFKEIMLKNTSKKYFYQCLETDKYYFFNFEKLRLNNTIAINDRVKEENIHQGIYIDIFPLVPFPNDIKEQKKLYKKIKEVHILIEADLKDKAKYEHYGRVGKIVSKMARVVPRGLRNKVAIKLLKQIILYNGEYDNYYDLSENVIYSKKLFDKKELMQFEKKKYSVPKGYDECLRKIYGDYMTPPKEEDRVAHEFSLVKFDD